jgi:hypothetical protein
VCSNESVLVGCEVGGAATAERCLEQVGSGKMTLTATLSGFNQSLLYTVLVQFSFQFGLSNIQCNYYDSILEQKLLTCTLLYHG